MVDNTLRTHLLKHKVERNGLDERGLVALGAHKVAGARLLGQALGVGRGLAGGLGGRLLGVVVGQTLQKLETAGGVLHVLDAHVDLLLDIAVLDALVHRHADGAPRHVEDAA